MRHDERAVACGASRTLCRGSRRARRVGKERAANHRAHATDVLLARPSHDLAAAAADICAWLGRAFEMARAPAHQDGIALADGDGAIKAFLAHICLAPASRPAPRCAIIENRVRTMERHDEQY